MFGESFKQWWRPNRAIIFYAWDGEEPGLRGATEWAKHHAQELKPEAVVYIDMDSRGEGWFSASRMLTSRRRENPPTGSSKPSAARAMCADWPNETG